MAYGDESKQQYQEALKSGRIKTGTTEELSQIITDHQACYLWGDQGGGHCVCWIAECELERRGIDKTGILTKLWNIKKSPPERTTPAAQLRKMRAEKKEYLEDTMTKAQAKKLFKLTDKQLSEIPIEAKFGKFRYKKNDVINLMRKQPKNTQSKIKL